MTYCTVWFLLAFYFSRDWNYKGFIIFYLHKPVINYSLSICRFNMVSILHVFLLFYEYSLSWHFNVFILESIIIIFAIVEYIFCGWFFLLYDIYIQENIGHYWFNTLKILRFLNLSSIIPLMSTNPTVTNIWYLRTKPTEITEFS